mgnify:CR=1 FL=1
MYGLSVPDMLYKQGWSEEEYSNTSRKKCRFFVNKEFFLVKNEIIDNKKIFFLATDKEIKKFINTKLINLNNFN